MDNSKSTQEAVAVVQARGDEGVRRGSAGGDEKSGQIFKIVKRQSVQSR